MNKVMGWNSPLWYNFEIAYGDYSDLESLKGYLPDLLNYEKSKRDRNSETSSKQDLWTLPYKINRNCGRRNRRFHSKHILSCHLASARVKSSALTRSTHLHPQFFASHYVLPLYLQNIWIMAGAPFIVSDLRDYVDFDKQLTLVVISDADQWSKDKTDK